eukprot:11829589-Alexandrium_andersonii.AAC.1
MAAGASGAGVFPEGPCADQRGASSLLAGASAVSKAGGTAAGSAGKRAPAPCTARTSAVTSPSEPT